jgi:hypothetical protein
MRIFHSDTNQVFEDIELFLTKEEMLGLVGWLEGLAENPKGHHIHFMSDNKEITVAICTEDNLNEFDERSKEVILYDK